MLSEGAKPGTPRIEPSRIFGTSVELKIVVSLLYVLYSRIFGTSVELKIVVSLLYSRIYGTSVELSTRTKY